ncbi:MAG TPA: hypothetical protein VMB66_00275 [Candidatus Acidoferrales bacterium]|nr:hypothetical protein [Candidatus Acidoferrales bacterium]
MGEEKTVRVATAVGFLAGVIACLDAIRDVKTLWPPDALWQILPHPRRLELVAGIALIVVSLIITSFRTTTA